MNEGVLALLILGAIAGLNVLMSLWYMYLVRAYYRKFDRSSRNYDLVVLSFGVVWIELFRIIISAVIDWYHGMIERTP